MRLSYTSLLMLMLSSLCTSEEPRTIPEPQQYGVYRGHPYAGVFACFNVVIGALDAYDTGRLGGLTVDFGTMGLYYDKNRDSNWWNYYFKPIVLGNKRLPHIGLCEEQISKYSKNGMFALSRKRCKRLIDKYIHIKKNISKQVSSFIKKRFHNKKYVAVQYRGNDKFGLESDYISQESVCNAVSKILLQRKLTKRKIFVATDVASFVDVMVRTFGKRVIYTKASRSRDGKPIHYRPDINGYGKGLEAMIDCLILSRACLLIRTASNLSNAALIFNPKLKSILLNRSTLPDR